MVVQFECTYCGYIWKNHVYEISRDKVYRCIKCDDPNVWTRDISSERIDYYGTTVVSPDIKRKKFTGTDFLD